MKKQFLPLIRFLHKTVMYSLSAYCKFISDKVRTDAYVEALKQAVKKDSVVLDIGAGTGFFAILACKFGAKKAYAVEINEAILLGREIAEANGVADRVEFIQNDSKNITLPERADIAIFDLRGPTPLTNHNIPTVIDARERLLKPDSVFIPKRDSIKAALIEAFDDYERDINTKTSTQYGLDLSASHRFLVNEFYYLKAKGAQLLSMPQECFSLDYSQITLPDFIKKLQWRIETEGTAHGLALWFDVELGENIFYSTSPFATQKVKLYNHPILYFQSPVSVAVGDMVNVNLQAKLFEKDYVWRWDTVVKTADGKVKANFRQSTLLARILLPMVLSKESANV